MADTKTGEKGLFLVVHFLYVELTKTQMAGHICEELFLKSFDMGRPNSNLSLAVRRSIFKLAIPRGGSLYKGPERKKFAFFLPV